MSHCVPPSPDSFQPPRRLPSLDDRNGRDAADVVAAFLYGKLGHGLPVTTLRAIAEAMVDNMLDNDFVIMPIDGIDAWADHFREAGI